MADVKFNKAIDILYANVEDVTNELLTQILEKEEMILFFYAILTEFGAYPDNIREIFRNNNPNNNNLNLIFKENVQNILANLGSNPINFFDGYSKYIQFALNSEDLSHIYICYNTCRRLIINISYNSNMLNKEKLDIIQKSISLLCFTCPNAFKYNITNNNIIVNNINEIKRRLILQESFSLFKEYIKTKNKIHLYQLTKNYITQLINEYSTNSHIQLLLLYHIFQQRNFQIELMNVHHQTMFNFDIYKESFYGYFDYLDLYYDYFIVQKNQNFELENIFVVLMSQITKYFPKYNLFNLGLISEIKKFEKEKINFFSFYDREFFIKNIRKFNNIFFFKNPYKAAILFINIIMKNKILNNLDGVNYYDVDKIYKNFKFFMDNDIKEEQCENNDTEETKKNMVSLFLKSCMIIFILLSNELITFAPVIEPDNMKFKNNSVKFFYKLIYTLFLLLKNYNKYITVQTKDKLLTLMNEICISNPLIYHYILQNDSFFDEELVHFLIENITFNPKKQLDFILKYDKPVEPEIFLNGLIMFGYWVNKYPYKERYLNGLNILTCIQKVIDIRGLLKNDKNVDKFILGIYLFFKAFPKSKNDTKGFLNFLSKEIDYSFENKAKEKIDNLCQFIKKELFMNDCYSNKNTLFVDINDFLKNNFNK